jgi:GxxExxY protein
MCSGLTEREEFLGREIVDAAYKVHKQLGPGLLEKIYEACFCYELDKRGIPNKRQIDLPIYYDGQVFDEGLRLDVFVDELIVCELKARELINPLWPAQLISHLKLTKCKLGFLINFNVPLIKNGIKRFII